MSGSRAEFNQVNIVSSNPEAAIEFYRRLGVEIPENAIRRTASGIHHVSAVRSEDGLTLDLDSTAFAQIWNIGWSGAAGLAGRIVVGFGVGSRKAVDDTYADMTGAGYSDLQPPYDAFWGALRGHRRPRRRGCRHHEPGFSRKAHTAAGCLGLGAD